MSLSADADLSLHWHVGTPQRESALPCWVSLVGSGMGPDGSEGLPSLGLVVPAHPVHPNCLRRARVSAKAVSALCSRVDLQKPWAAKKSWAYFRNV